MAHGFGAAPNATSFGDSFALAGAPCIMVAESGIEPETSPYEDEVLPLHYSAWRNK